MIFGIRNDCDHDSYSVNCDGRTIYRAPAFIEQAYVVDGGVLVLYRGHDVLPREGALWSEYAELSEEQIDVAGSNIVLVDAAGEMMWRVRATRPHNRRGVDFGYQAVELEDGVWRVYGRDRYTYRLDLKTGALSDPVKYC